MVCHIDREPLPNVPDGLVQSTLKACAEVAVVEIARRADPSSKTVQVAIAQFEREVNMEDREPLFPRDQPSFWRRASWKINNAWTFIRNIPSNVVMIYQWIPILWNNWDWDYNFLQNIIKYKLSRMSKHIREEDILVKSQEIADQMDVCVACIDRIQKEEYTEQEEEEHRKKWGEIKYDLIACEDSRCKQLDIYSPLARAQEKEEEERAEKMVIRELNEKRLEADYDLLFDTMRKNIRSWWS